MKDKRIIRCIKNLTPTFRWVFRQVSYCEIVDIEVRYQTSL